MILLGNVLCSLVNRLDFENCPHREEMHTLELLGRFDSEIYVSFEKD